MEFPDIYERNIKKIGKLKERSDKLRERIQLDLQMLEKRQAQLDDKRLLFKMYEDLKAENPEDAEVFWVENGLGKTQSLLDKNTTRFQDDSEKMREVEALMDKMRGELDQIINFDPVEQQFESVMSEGKRATQKEWKHVPNCKFKIFQDIFAPPGYRILPREEGLFGGDGYKNLTADLCIVDPKLFDGKFVGDFGLLQDQKGMTEYERLVSRVNAIERLKEFFWRLKPMSPYGAGEGNENYRLLISNGYGDVRDGKVIKTLRLGTQSRIPDRKVIQVYKNSYTAHRGCIDVLEGHKREIPEISQIRQRIESINKKVKGMKADNPERKNVSESIDKEIEKLEGVLEEFKLAAYDLLKKTRNIRDSRSQHNPGKTCAQLLGVIRALGNRLPKINDIDKEIESDKNDLFIRINGEKALLDQAGAELEGIIEKIKQDEKKVKEIGDIFYLKNPDIEKAVTTLPDFSQLELSPFIHYGRGMSKAFQNMRTANGKDVKEVARQAEKALLAHRIFKIQDACEKIQNDLVMAGDNGNLVDFYKKVCELNNIAFASRSISRLEDSETAEFFELCGKISSIRHNLEERISENPDEEKRKGLLKWLKQDLEKIDFLSALSELD